MATTRCIEQSPLFSLLVTLHNIGRILRSSLPRTEGYKADRYGEDNEQGGDIEPLRLCDAVGERLQQREVMYHATGAATTKQPSSIY